MLPGCGDAAVRSTSDTTVTGTCMTAPTPETSVYRYARSGGGLWRAYVAKAASGIYSIERASPELRGADTRMPERAGAIC